MQKNLTAYLGALIPVGIGLLVSVLIYKQFPTNVALIVVLFISFISVLLSIGFFKKIKREKVTENITSQSTHNLPPLERDLIYVTSTDFANKFSKETGDLYVGGEKVNDQPIQLVEVSYKKLTDEILIKFTGGISIRSVLHPNVAVGDTQFALYGMAQLDMKVNKDLVVYTPNGSKWSVSQNNKTSQFSLADRYPIMIFVWDEIYQAQ